MLRAAARGVESSLVCTVVSRMRAWVTTALSAALHMYGENMKRQQPERAEQRAILDLLKLVHAEVWVLGTVRKRGDWPGTRQTPGLPDILAFVRCPLMIYPPAQFIAIEVKASSGRLSPDQRRFEAACRRADVTYLVGGVDAVLAWLRARGHRV